MTLCLSFRSWRSCSGQSQSLCWLTVRRMWICFTNTWLLDTGWVLKDTRMLNPGSFQGAAASDFIIISAYIFLHLKDTLDDMLRKSFPVWVLLVRTHKSKMKRAEFWRSWMLCSFRITYTEAIDILKRSSETFTFPTDVRFCFFFLPDIRCVSAASLFPPQMSTLTSLFFSSVGLWPDDRTREVPGETLRQHSSVCHWLPLWPEALLCKRQPGPSQAYSKTGVTLSRRRRFKINDLTARFRPRGARWVIAGDLHNRGCLCAGSCSGPPRARSRRALRGLAQRGEAGSAEVSAGRVRMHTAGDVGRLLHPYRRRHRQHSGFRGKKIHFCLYAHQVLYDIFMSLCDINLHVFGFVVL